MGLACSRSVTNRVGCGPALLPQTVLDVEPLYQRVFGCGPAALTMVLNYHGIDISLDAATEELYSESLKGTLITDMRKLASRYLSSARIEKSTSCAVMEAVSHGNPVILFVDLGTGPISSPHYVVVVGYDIDRQELVYHNGFSKFITAPIEEINEKWKKTGFLALFVAADKTGTSSPSHSPVHRVQRPRDLHRP